MSRLNANQVRGLLGSSEFDVRSEGEDHYVILWPTDTSAVRLEVCVADDPDDDEWATMLIEAVDVMTVPLSHPEAVIIYHEVLSQAIASSDLGVRFDPATGGISFGKASCTPMDAGFEAANLSAVESAIAAFASAVVRLLEQVDKAVATGKPRHVRDAEKLDQDIAALFNACADEFPAKATDESVA